MPPPRPLLLLLAAALAPSPAVSQDCRLCDATGLAVPAGPTLRPLSVEVDGGLEFGRLALTGGGGGAAELSARDEQTRTDGRLLDLGGLRYAAVVRLVGQPGGRVRVHWPATLLLRSTGGGVALRLEAIRSDSPGVLVLNGNGRADFRLGGRLVVPAGGRRRLSRADHRRSGV